MKTHLCLIACLAGLPLSAMAEQPFAFEPGLVHMVEMIGLESDVVILFAAGPEGEVSGRLVSQDGSPLCPDAWHAKAQPQGDTLKFTEITLSPSACQAQNTLLTFSERLVNIATGSTTEEGIVLSNEAGTPLLRLTVGG